MHADDAERTCGSPLAQSPVVRPDSVGQHPAEGSESQLEGGGASPTAAASGAAGYMHAPGTRDASDSKQHGGLRFTLLENVPEGVAESVTSQSCLLYTSPSPRD